MHFFRPRVGGGGGGWGEGGAGRGAGRGWGRETPFGGSPFGRVSTSALP